MVVIAGCLIVRDGKILMVKEAKKKCYGQWNFPAGHVDENELITDGKEEKKEDALQNPMEQANKNMMYIMPIMSISIALVAPLGLALYWLVNNVLMIIERLVLNKYIKDEK